jgi:hypothetical protein
MRKISHFPWLPEKSPPWTAQCIFFHSGSLAGLQPVLQVRAVWTLECWGWCYHRSTAWGLGVGAAHTLTPKHIWVSLLRFFFFFFGKHHLIRFKIIGCSDYKITHLQKPELQFQLSALPPTGRWVTLASFLNLSFLSCKIKIILIL